MFNEYIEENTDSAKDQMQNVHTELANYLQILLGSGSTFASVIAEAPEILTAASLNLNFRTGACKVTATYKRVMCIPGR